MNALNGIKIVLDLDDGDFRVRIQKDAETIKVFGREAENAIKPLKGLERAVTGWGASLRDFFVTTSMVRGAFSTLQLATVGWIGALADASGKFERLQVMMEGFSDKSTGAARQLEAASNVDYLIDLSKKVPFSLDEISNSFVKLKSVGIDPTAGSLQTLADTIAKFGGSDQQLHRATVAIQQMAGKGVISMEELRQQLGEAVPNAFQTMARALNMTTSEMIQKISLGQVEASSALAKFFAQARLESEGASLAMMGTWTGLLSQLKTEWTIFLKELGAGGLYDETKRVVERMIGALRDPRFRQAALGLGDLLVQMMRTIASLAEFVADHWDEITGVAKMAALLFALGKAQQLMGFAAKTTIGLLGEGGLALGLFGARAMAAGAAANAFAAGAGRAAMALTVVSTVMASIGGPAAGVVTSIGAIVVAIRALIVGLAQAGASLAAARIAMAAMPGTAIAASAALTGVVGAVAALAMPIGIAVAALGGLIYWLKKARDEARETNEELRRTNGASFTDEKILDVKERMIETEKELADLRREHDEQERQRGPRNYQLALENARAFKAKEAELLKQIEVDRESLDIMHAARQRQRVQEIADADQRAMRESLVNAEKKFAADEEALSRRLSGLSEQERSEQHLQNIRARNIEQEKVYQALLDEKRKRIEALQRQLAGAEKSGTPGRAADIRRGIAIWEESAMQVQQKLAELRTQAAATEQTLSSPNVLLGSKDGLKNSLSEFRSLANSVEERLAKLKEQASHPGSSGYLRETQAQLEIIKRKLAEVGEDGSANSAKLRGEMALLEKQILAGASAIERLEAIKKFGAAMADLSGEIRKAASELSGLNAKVDEWRVKLNDGTFGDVKLMSPEARASAEEAIDMLDKLTQAREKAKSAMSGVDTIQSAAEGLSDDNLTGREKEEALHRKNLARYQRYIEDLNAADQLRQQFIVEYQATEAERRENHLAAMAKATTAAERETLQRTFDDKQAAYQLALSQEEEFSANRQKLQEAYGEFLKQESQRHTRAMLTPMQQTNLEWQKILDRMQDAMVHWADRVTDAFVEMARTGKFQFKDLVNSILEDIYRLVLQKNVIGPLMDSISGLMSQTQGAGGSSSGGLLNAAVAAATAYFGAGSGSGTSAPSTGGGAFSDPNWVPKFAGGGAVFGPGGPTSDKIRAWLSNGEFVVRADAVKRLGLDLMEAINSGDARAVVKALNGKTAAPRFAEGGLVGDWTKKAPDSYAPTGQGEHSRPASRVAGDMNIAVNVINESGTPVKGDAGQPKFDGEKMVLDVVLRAVNRPGAFRDSMKGALS